MKINQINSKFLFWSLATAAGYLLFAYHLNRSNFTELISLYVGLFFAFYFLLRIAPVNSNFLFGAGILFRLLFLFAIPNLSQDYFRFIWDGRMIWHGYNPYQHLPDSIILNADFTIPQALELHAGMGSLSSGHFTNYPPLNQCCFFIAALFAGKSIFGSVIVFKVIILLADIGTYHFGRKLLQNLYLPRNNIFFYFLNPLVIIELSGNLHFEGVMVFFLVWSFYLIQKHSIKKGAIVFALSVAVKLVPLIMLPLLFRYFKFQKAIVFYSLVGIVCILLFLPFYSTAFIQNYSSTVALWFNNFEFNASIYYLFRAIGYNITGYNQIHLIGKITPFIIILTVIAFSLPKKNELFKNTIANMLLSICFYFFLSTTVHPWYIITALVLSVFTPFRFPIVWSMVIMLSYYAYSNATFKENHWLLFLEYILVFAALLWELLYKKPLPILKRT